MIKKILFVCVLYSTFSWGQPTPDEFDAWNAYDAGLYNLTLKYYQQLLDTPLSPEERTIALYDLGTTYLSVRDYPNALKNLQQSLQNTHDNPLVAEYAKINLAITRLWQVQDLMTKPSFDPAQGLDWIRTAEYDLQEAELYSCQQSKREGYENCPINLNIESIKTALIELRAKIPTPDHRHSMIPTLAFLQGALYAWKSDQPILADVLLDLALEEANAKWEGSDTSSPEKLLKDLIYHQRELQHLGIQMGAINNLPLRFLKASALGQKSINQMAAQFYSVVYDAQSDLFHQPSPIGNPDKRIALSPWDSVLPLFDQGLTDSYLAFDALEKQNLQFATHKEETSATYWEQALAFLLNPPNAAEAPQPAEGPKEEQPKPEENQNQEQQAQNKESVENVLSHLQEMDLETKPRGDQNALKTEGLPW